nr:MAG TPA: hypothetical protein [Caudoviricetes sp.]DAV41484.1 MAG TPA: hypothetical protein [Caudoviricetes sp.]DAW20082.1 MAG TPA: hypothetical protein [Caudoviricetes sp.]DAW89301.1 MAG TPA: hypothetical protein [Caudoviricetes sp.]
MLNRLKRNLLNTRKLVFLKMSLKMLLKPLRT